MFMKQAIKNTALKQPKINNLIKEKNLIIEYKFSVGFRTLNLLKKKQIFFQNYLSFIYYNKIFVYI